MKLEMITNGDSIAYVDMEKVVAIYEQDDSDSGGSANQVYLGVEGLSGSVPVDGTIAEVAKKVRYINGRA